MKTFNQFSEGLKQARKNIGMDPDKPSCWKGYKAKGTKTKGGKEVPNCVKEDSKYGYDKKGNSLNPKDKNKKKKVKKKVKFWWDDDGGVDGVYSHGQTKRISKRLY